MTAKACLNCGAALTGQFCAACGQKDQNLHRPFWALFEDYVEANFHADSRLWRTLGLMLWAPGLVARRHLDGKRARYVTPVKFYVFATIMFFIVFGFSGVGLLVLVPDPGAGIGMVVMERGPTRSVETPRVAGIGFTLASFMPLDRVPRVPPSRMPDSSVSDPKARELVSTIGGLATSPEKLNELLEAWLPRLLILLVPLFALVLKVVLGRAGVLYDHLVFSLYLHAYLFVLLTIMVAATAAAGALAPAAPVGEVFLGVMTAVLGFGLFHVYGGGVARTLARLVACLAGYVVILTAAFNGLLLYGLG